MATITELDTIEEGHIVVQAKSVIDGRVVGLNLEFNDTECVRNYNLSRVIADAFDDYRKEKEEWKNGVKF